MQLPLNEPFQPYLARSRRAVVVADLVESVRLLRDFENDVISRWRRFVSDVRAEVLPAHDGRMVKSLGDGMLLEFQTTLGSIQAVLEINRRLAAYNVGCPAAAQLHLRFGVHEAEIVVDDLDVYGVGVNLASRLSTLAGPDEIVISPEARGALVDDLDAGIEDLGDCYLKHFSEPQRAYRVGPLGSHPIMWSGGAAGTADRVTVAVVPFPARGERSADPLGEILADDLIARLSQLRQLHVVSRLSTTVFRERELKLSTLSSTLGCHYVVHGSCVVNAGVVRLRAQIVDCHDGAVLWADRLDGTVAEVLSGESPIVERLTEHVCHALVGAEVCRAATTPLPSLQSYTILLGSIAMMHRLSRHDFDRSREMLLYLIERHPRATSPRAWLGKWHVMRVAQGWSSNPTADAHEARSIVNQALDMEPQHSLALAIDGLICAYISKDLSTAGERYEAAIRSNPSEGLAWLFQSALHSYNREGQLAVECAMRAQSLSPLDPMKYYYDNFTSTAKLSAEDYEGAIEWGTRSLRANRTHGPTLRVLAIAQVLAGRIADAQGTMREMLKVEPSFSVARFVDRYPGAASPHTSKYADALRAAGLPN